MNNPNNCGCDSAPTTEAAPEPQVLDSVVVCTDGALSGAGGRQGACSSHGGVSKPS
jgi:hypothetical protein